MQLDARYGEGTAVTDQNRWSITKITDFLKFQYTGTDFIYDMQMAFVASASAIILLFVFFNFGQMFHTNLSSLGITIYRTEWYRYPRRVQLFVLFMIKRSQQSFYLSAFGIMAVNLQNYVGVSMKRYDRKLRVMSCGYLGI